MPKHLNRLFSELIFRAPIGDAPLDLIWIQAGAACLSFFSTLSSIGPLKDFIIVISLIGHFWCQFLWSETLATFPSQAPLDKGLNP
jgi:hypothetical protein